MEKNGFKIVVDEKTLTIQIPKSIIINSFNYYHNNSDGTKIRSSKRQEFIELVAVHLNDEIDPETGDTHITQMIDGVFESFLDGYIDTFDIIEFPKY